MNENRVRYLSGEEKPRSLSLAAGIRGDEIIFSRVKLVPFLMSLPKAAFANSVLAYVGTD